MSLMVVFGFDRLRHAARMRLSSIRVRRFAPSSRKRRRRVRELRPILSATLSASIVASSGSWESTSRTRSASAGVAWISPQQSVSGARQGFDHLAVAVGLSLEQQAAVEDDLAVLAGELDAAAEELVEACAVGRRGLAEANLGRCSVGNVVLADAEGERAGELFAKAQGLGRERGVKRKAEMRPLTHVISSSRRLSTTSAE